MSSGYPVEFLTDDLFLTEAHHKKYYGVCRLPKQGAKVRHKVPRFRLEVLFIAIIFDNFFPFSRSTADWTLSFHRTPNGPPAWSGGPAPCILSAVCVIMPIKRACPCRITRYARTLFEWYNSLYFILFYIIFLSDFHFSFFLVYHFFFLSVFFAGRRNRESRRNRSDAHGRIGLWSARSAVPPSGRAGPLKAQTIKQRDRFYAYSCSKSQLY